METDAILLERYASTFDADAFTELIRRHAALVNGVALRVLGNREQAQDVVQDCFIELARKAATITSLPGWLHSLARSRALDLIRRESIRREHEENAAASAPAHEGREYNRVAQLVDEGIENLKAELATPLMLHFFEGRTHAEVAELLDIDRTTATRRIDRAVEELREWMEKKGTRSAGPAFAGILSQFAAASEISREAYAGLAKIAIAGVGKPFAATVAGGGLFMKALVAALVIAAAGTGVGVVMKKPRIGAIAPAAAASEYALSEKHTVGWRGDGTANFPSDNPPTNWYRRALGGPGFACQGKKPGTAKPAALQHQTLSLTHWAIIGY